jgi:hypothetical protein
MSGNKLIDILHDDAKLNNIISNTDNATDTEKYFMVNLLTKVKEPGSRLTSDELLKCNKLWDKYSKEAP